MIKKSVFEEDLVAGMHRELVKNATSQDPEGVETAVDYLNSAIDIFEDAGMKAQSDQVLRILAKIAITRPQQYPSLQALMEHGVTPGDLKDISKDQFSRARVNLALRKLGYSDEEIAGFLGIKNLMSEKEALEITNPEGTFSKILNWMQNPKEVFPSAELKEGDEFNISSVAQDHNFANKKPKDPRKISDRHTKGLTPDKMVNNLKNHGTVFNMADDSNAGDTNDIDIPQPESFEEDYQKYIRMLEHQKKKKVTQDDIDPDLAGLIELDAASEYDLLSMALDTNEVDIPQPDTFDEDYQNYMRMLERQNRKKITKHDIDPDLEGLVELDSTDADDLLSLDIGEGSLEVSEHPEVEDFEDERD